MNDSSDALKEREAILRYLKDAVAYWKRATINHLVANALQMAVNGIEKGEHLKREGA
jgi:hypothetical protein